MNLTSTLTPPCAPPKYSRCATSTIPQTGTSTPIYSPGEAPVVTDDVGFCGGPS